MYDQVSIIVPVYNSEQYLEATVNSLRNQTYKNIQIILIEGYSSDRSPEMCRMFSEMDKRVSVIYHSENFGPERARNDGIEQAKGEWFIFVDSDDLLFPNSIELLVEQANKLDCDVLFAGFNKVMKGNSTTFLPNISEKCYSKKEISGLILKDISLAIVSCVGSKLYRTSIARENMLRVDKTCRHNADLAFTMDYLAVTDRIGILNKSVYQYLLRENSMLTSYRPGVYETTSKARKKIRILYESEGCFGEMKYYYYNMRKDILVDALSDAVIYNADFVKEFNKYMSDTENFETVDYLLGCKPSLRRRILLVLIRRRNAKALYYYLKLSAFFQKSQWRM